MNVRLTRRQALRLGLAAGIVGCAGYLGATRDRLVFGGAVLRQGWLRVAGGSTAVAVVRCPTYDQAEAAVRQAWDLIGGPELAGKSVVLKANLIDYVPDRPANTAPAVLVAAIRYLKAHGAREIVVADGPAFKRDAEELLIDSGLAAALSAEDVRFVDLNYDDLVKVEVKGQYTRLSHLLLPRTVVEADVLISVPKMKTHHWTWVSLSMKNLFGVVPGGKYGWPKNRLHFNGIEASIVQLYETLGPQLALVDGVIGMEGDGPVCGQARPTGVVVMGADLVAVDATCARIMGFPPQEIAHLALAERFGLGRLDEGRIDVRGEPLAAVRQSYAEPPVNLGRLSG